MITITEQKPLDEIIECLDECKEVYLIGCGTCATMLHTGGKSEVLKMKDKLEDSGKKVTGWMVIPTACDKLTKDALKVNAKEIEAANAILVMSCAFGVQTVSLYADKSAYPALNTLCMAKEETPGHLTEICMQCGNCVLGQTAGICPMTQCAKGLLNGPCGGPKKGKCEQEPEHDCAWILIYDRLKNLGELDKLKEMAMPVDYTKMKRPRTFNLIPVEE